MMVVELCCFSFFVLVVEIIFLQFATAFDRALFFLCDSKLHQLTHSINFCLLFGT